LFSATEEAWLFLEGKGMPNKRSMIVLLVAVCAARVSAQVPFALTPGWVSTDLPNHSTGAAWADINRDGWMDLVVANGNDMGREHVVVYYNDGAGHLPTIPGWQSADIDYHGHVSVGDVNGDGYPDVAVSVYIGASGFSQKGYVKVYMNRQGTLESAPSWRSKDSMYTFSCSFGDANGDGRQDLAVACGESYGNNAERNRIYYNRGGALDTLPGWATAAAGFSYDVTWADFDRDGRLDLVFACEDGPNVMYRNYGDSLGTVPFWKSSDAPEYANSLFAGDVNNDSYADLAVSDNNQLGGSGRFKVYRNTAGVLDTLPFWTSSFSGYGSGITLADIDNNGSADLITGGWWEPCRIYVNQGGTFTVNPQWSSNTGSVIEAIVLADVGNSGLDTQRTSFLSDGTRRLFAVPRTPLQAILAVNAGSVSLSPAAYCYDREGGWVSLGSAPPPGDTITVVALVSRHLDLAMTNWDANLGNYLFVNTGPVIAVRKESGTNARFDLLQNYPNPFNPTTVISCQWSVVSEIRLVVYDILGREVAVLAQGLRQPGIFRIPWNADGFSSGTYFCRLEATAVNGEKSVQMMKMTLVK
jgi:hypothetical protein